MQKFVITLFLTLATCLSFAQDKGTLTGTVMDADSKESLIGVNISTPDGQGTTTDFDGLFTITLPAGSHDLTFSYIGYETVIKTVALTSGTNPPMDVEMGFESIEFDEVVVSGSRYAKRVSEEVISIEVIKPSLADNTAAIKLDDLAKRVTGLSVADGQASIRAGSGWSYSIGSRVNIVLDGQSLLTPDRSSIKWRYIPMENVGQIEVLKGASSVLYGSSAMNGTIHLQSIKPSSTPETKFVSYVEMLDQYRNDDYNWYNARVTTGGYLTRSHKVSDHFEYVVGLNANYQQQPYYGYNDYHIRANLNTKWTSKKDAKSSWGFKLNYTYYLENEFIFWEGPDELALFPDSDVGYKYHSFNVDPFYIRYDKKDNKHLIQSRIFYYDPEADRNGGFSNIEYQFSKRFDKGWNVIAGAGQDLIIFNSSNLGGLNYGFKWAAFGQVDKKWEKISLTGGMRSEFFKIKDITGVAYATAIEKSDGTIQELPIPLMRFGLNYHPRKNSFLRFNIGQAFRLPSLTEYFIDYKFSGISILANPNLRPEYGWTAELGFKQNWQTKKVYRGTLDAAFFWQEYKDLIEFQPALVGVIALVPTNLPTARIAGYEASIKQSINKGQHRLNLDVGYTYAFPVELSGVEGVEMRNVGTYLKNLFRYAGPVKNVPESFRTSALLKYRNRHLVNLVFEYENDVFIFGLYGRYYSIIENGDFEFDSDVFSFIPGITDYWTAKFPEGDFVADLTAGVKFLEKHSISLTVKNFTNREYTLRLGKIEAPRSWGWKYKVVF
ncbi:MAG: TonB-dependent receptor [Bacteroidetes bacterium]|nr:TonB-dependent receptor [Bacteroidota bacterium]